MADLRPSPSPGVSRRFPTGAEVTRDGLHVRTWAPDVESVEVVLFAPGDTPSLPMDEPPADVQRVPLRSVRGGMHEGLVPAGTGTRYALHLLGAGVFPDPASRSQPLGPLGPSEVVDPHVYRWRTADWKGIEAHRHVFYELHVGTFTSAGTYAAVHEHLPRLAELGVTTVELMPVAEFGGRFGWGYDGVALFAPSHLYGTPDELRSLVDAAHGHGLAVVLDVVYNHFGPVGCFLDRFAADWFTRDDTEWGRAVNVAHPNVRETFVANVRYWIDEFRFDGLRLDATHAIHDPTPVHIVTDIVAAAKSAAPGRHVLVVAENDDQDVRFLTTPGEGGSGCDAAWNDDFHHAARVALTGRREAFMGDFRGTPQELLSAARHGYLLRGQWSTWRSRPRGRHGRIEGARRFVHYLENHDQAGNTVRGARVHHLSDPGRLRALTALLLLEPALPLLFQGQECGAQQPFHYFADHDDPWLRDAVRQGRARELLQLPSAAMAEQLDALPDPVSEETFRACVLDWGQLSSGAPVVALHRELLRIRREDPTIAAAEPSVDGAVLGPDAFCLRWTSPSGDDRLLVVNLDTDLPLVPVAEPLLAPGEQGTWWRILSTEDPRFGGLGAPPWSPDKWRVPGHSAELYGPGD